MSPKNGSAERGSAEPSGLYRLLRPALYALPAETAHNLAMGALQAAQAAGAEELLEGLYAPEAEPSLSVEAFGHRFAHPLGLAAGFDKDAVAFEALLASGFSFVEVGTVTAHPQRGNPRPRLFRLPGDRALINRMGFNNGGAEAAARRLSRRKRARGVLGVNIGKSKTTPEADAASDYAFSAGQVGPHADYLVVNVSSPNTPGLRNLQSVEKLEPILRQVRGAADRKRLTPVPLLVKIAPDLADEDVDAVAQLATHLKLAGIVATNTTIKREPLGTPRDRIDAIGAGGLSGAPLKTRSLEVLRRLRAAVPPLTLIAVGGIETADDARQRLEAGANLLQAYTAYVYQGPTFAKRLIDGLSER